MGDNELLEMLASETDRRTPTIVEGVRDLADSTEPNAKGIEEIRVEAHGLKGAAMVVGQNHLSELAKEIEVALVQRVASGTIDRDLAAKIVAAIEAFQGGVQAAARGEAEPASVGESITALSADEPV